MEKEKLDKMAKEFAWAHDTIGVDKETFSRDCPDVMKMVRIPVDKEMEHAFKCGAVWWEKEIIEEAVESTTPPKGRRPLAAYAMEEKIKKAAEAYHNRVAEANDNAEAYDFSGAFIAGAEFALNNLWTSVEEGAPRRINEKQSESVNCLFRAQSVTYYGCYDYYYHVWVTNGGSVVMDVTSWMEIPE